MGDSCCHPRGIGSIKAQIEAAYPGIFVYSVATGKTEEEDVMSTYFGNANAQVEQVCAELSSLPQLRGRPFVGVGFSQGGLLLRALIQRCTGPDAPKAHTLITMGSPHNGVGGVPGCWISHGNNKQTTMGLGNPRQQLVYQPAITELGYGWCEVRGFDLSRKGMLAVQRVLCSDSPASRCNLMSMDATKSIQRRQ